MDDALCVGELQPAADVLRDLQRPLERQRAACFPKRGSTSPAISSVTMYGWPSCSPRSKTETMCGWAPSRPIACASRVTRCAPERVEALGLDQRERDVAVEQRVVREEDALLGALAEEAPHLVAAGGEGGGKRLSRDRDLCLSRARPADGLTARVAELLAAGIGRATRRTDEAIAERRRALTTELGAVAVLVAA